MPTTTKVIIMVFVIVAIAILPAIPRVGEAAGARTVEAKTFLLPETSWGQVPIAHPEQDQTQYLPIVSVHSIQGMVYVRAGEFQMGCVHWAVCDNGDTPPHPVFLESFYIDQYEVTNAQYEKCVAAGVCASPAATSSHSRASYYGNPLYADYPVFHISWQDARNYCEWLEKRLPTEAEWEKAAQGGLNVYQNKYPWGDAEPVCQSGADNGAHFDECTPADSVHIGSFRPNSYGLYDMAGNVWEWVYDWWDTTYYSFSPYYNPTGPENGSVKVIRGGGWSYYWSGLRWAARNYRDPNSALGNHDIGFRCVTSPGT